MVFGGFRFKREREIKKERDWRRELDGAISLLRLGLGRVSESFLSLFLSQAVSVSPFSLFLSFRKLFEGKIKTEMLLRLVSLILRSTLKIISV